MSGITRIVQFGLEGIPGATGPAGAAGPAGPAGAFPAPVAGVVTIDPAAKRIDSYRSSQSTEGGIVGTGLSAVILQHKLGLRSSRVILQMWAAGDGVIQTIDGARRITYSAGTATYAIAVSGPADVPDDFYGLGGTFATTIVTVGPDRFLQISGTISAPYTLGAVVNEVY